MKMENEIDIDKIVDEIFEQPKKVGRPKKKLWEPVTVNEVNKIEVILANAIAELNNKLRDEEMDKNKRIKYYEAKHDGFIAGIDTAIGVYNEAFKEVK